MEGAATTVYAQGGRGNARLIAWEGERTVTFTMEDALISAEGFSILTGAGLTKAEEKPIIVHRTEITNDVKKDDNYVEILVNKEPYLGENRVIGQYQSYQTQLVDLKEDFIYVMLLNDNGDIISEPYVVSEIASTVSYDNNINKWKIKIPQTEGRHTYASDFIDNGNNNYTPYRINDLSGFSTGCSVLVDYYTKEVEKAYQIDITPDDFSGNFYLEASTLFRAQNGVDMPAEFIIPNCKIQSNFTFTMASSGDPSTFTFTLDAFPDYTRWNKKKKVYAAIQIIEQGEITEKFERLGTPHDHMSDDNYEPFITYKKEQESYLDASPSEYLNQIIESMDENGNIYNNGLGYKKDCYILDEEGETIGDQNAPQNLIGKYTSIGFIPYKYGQIINIAGFIDDAQRSIQGIYFYNQEHKCIAVKTVKTNSIDYVAGYDPTEDSTIANKLTTVNYIRVTFYNQKLSEMAVYVSGVEKPLPEEENDNG